MRPTASTFSLFASSLALALTAMGCAVGTESAGESTGDEDLKTETASQSDGLTVGSVAAYAIRADMRKCAAPNCGGFYVRRLNGASTRCADGISRSECYLVGANLDNLGLSYWEESSFLDSISAGRAIVIGSIVIGSRVGIVIGSKGIVIGSKGSYGALVIHQAYVAQDAVAPSGTYYKVESNGTTCKKAPCFSYDYEKLNGTSAGTFSSFEADDARLQKTVTAAVTSGDDVIVAGYLSRDYSTGGKVLDVTQSFTRLRGSYCSDDSSSGGWDW